MHQAMLVPHPKGDAVANDLARRLVCKAREASLDQSRDSPFALLAKENDIMWGGGMPDDTSVIVFRVFGDPSSSRTYDY